MIYIGLSINKNETNINTAKNTPSYEKQRYR